jgi:predicted kinase
MATVIVLYGPKGAGKSSIARVLADVLGVHHVDVDALVPSLVDRGIQPDAVDGWLAPLLREVRAAAQSHLAVSVEATGAWDSDWRLADDLAADGLRVVRVWVGAPKPVVLDRVARRSGAVRPETVDEASGIYDAATANAATRRFDAAIDTSGAVADAQSVRATFASILVDAEQ